MEEVGKSTVLVACATYGSGALRANWQRASSRGRTPMFKNGPFTLGNLPKYLWALGKTQEVTILPTQTLQDFYN
jgi:hypothetical protein